MDDRKRDQRRTVLKCIAAGAAGISALPIVRAAEFPERPVRIVVATPPGGSTDTTARLIAERMTVSLGQPVLIEHKPGASGAIAATFVSNGPKDGYSIFFGTSSTLGYMKFVNKDLQYDPARDFIPVAMIGRVPVALYTSAASGILSIQDLVAAAKAKPGQLSYGSSGLLSTTHLAGEFFCQRADISMIHVPYTGAQTNYFNDLLGGQLQAAFTSLTSGLGLAKSGKLKLIAIASAKRSRLVPEVPALGEVYPGLDVPAWLGFAVAAGTPANIIQKLEASTQAALRDPTIHPQLFAAGVESDFLGASAFAAGIVAENRTWERTLKAAGLMK